MTRDNLLTMKRHLKGLVGVIEDILSKAPECEVCYTKYTLTNKCICDRGK